MIEYVKYISETVVEYPPRDKGSIINYNINYEMLTEDGFKELIPVKRPETNRRYHIEYVEHEENQKNLPLYNKKIDSIINYLENPIVVFKDYSQIETNIETLRNQIFEYKQNKDINYEYNYMFDFDEILYDEVIHYNTINNIDNKIPKKNTFKYEVNTIRKFNENVEAINDYLKKQLYINKTIIICLKIWRSDKFYPTP
jgi:hypothetical protein